MGAATHIEWTAIRLPLKEQTQERISLISDFNAYIAGDELVVPGMTFNPWEGCTKVSPGCANCYAESRNARFGGGMAPNWGKGAPRRRTSIKNWNSVRRWNRLAAKNGIRIRVFCASIADWLDDEVPIEWLADLLNLIRECKNLDWLMLTKRPNRWNFRMVLANGYAASAGYLDKLETCPRMQTAFWIAEWLKGNAPANLWIGTTVEDQHRADERIPELLKIPACIRFLSCEPLLGSVSFDLSLSGCFTSDYSVKFGKAGIHWVICGGESGHNARPMHPNWARQIRAQCLDAGVPFFFKQWGQWTPATQIGDKVEIVSTKPVPSNPEWFTCPTGELLAKVGKAAAGRLLDGYEWNQTP